RRSTLGRTELLLRRSRRQPLVLRTAEAGGTGGLIEACRRSPPPVARGHQASRIVILRGRFTRTLTHPYASRRFAPWHFAPLGRWSNPNATGVENARASKFVLTASRRTA